MKFQQVAIDRAAGFGATRLSCIAFEIHLVPPSKTVLSELPRVEVSASISHGGRIGKGCGEAEKKEEQAHERGHYV